MPIESPRCAALLLTLAASTHHAAADLVIHDNRDGAFVWVPEYKFGGDIYPGNFLDIRASASAQTGQENDASLQIRFNAGLASDEPSNRSIRSSSDSAISRALTESEYHWKDFTYLLRGARQYAMNESVGILEDWRSTALIYLHLPGDDSFDGGTPLIDPLAFVGVRIIEPDGLHYGWVLLNNYEQPLMWAYETTPYTPAFIPTPASAPLLASALLALRRRRS
jgi:uncharacterized protein (TIGR03382 family)